MSTTSLHLLSSLLVCTALLCGPASAADTNDVLEAESPIRLPDFGVNVYYSSMKIERGAIENPESVFGYGAEIEWYGFFGEVEACHDMTDINERAGRCNELECVLGYGYTLWDFTARAGYIYKKCYFEETDVQEVALEFEYETEWVTPYSEMLIGTWGLSGAYYAAFGLVREWELLEWMTLVTSASFGVGNARRNEEDFERNAIGAREMRLGAAFEIEVCPHVKLVPGIDFYDYFTEAQRANYDTYNGFAAVASCQLVAEF